jgi:hypothetical protein
MMTALRQMSNPLYTACYPPSFIWVCGCFGLVFHCLNIFWFYKILLKLKRKVAGKEKFTDKNSCEAYNQDEIAAKLEKEKALASASTNGAPNGIANRNHKKQL